MISRALLIALSCAYAAAVAPLSAAGDDNECALYLTGPGRTSAYDYSLNLLKGNFGYEGQHTCITYDAVNQAYLEARNRIVVSQPKGDWKAEDFASVGELLLDISISLARMYGLTYEEIEKGLPLIDTSRTLIREVCPPIFSHVECRAGKYRRLDGLCTNLQHPTWGATMSPFQRLIGPLFSDGINAPRIAHTGRDLPLSRVVSRTMHPDEGFHDHAGTVMVIAWGQFMDHDYTLTGTPLDPVNRNDPEECCKRPPHLKHPYCNEIRIPDDDYFYRLFGVKCIDFVRGFPSPRPGCRLGSRVPFNTLTGVIDGNTVYGVTEKFARKLRTGYGGLLRMNPVFKEYGLKDLLPLKLDIPDEGCTRPNKNMYCFEAGEIRVNEQLVLTVMHTLMAREHNRVARGLAEVNPHWDDETLFQEARRINIAEIQHITFNEFLPILLGKDVMEKFGLVLQKDGYWNGYDPEVNPDVIDSFAAAAYRFGHSLLPTAVERWSKAHKFIASKRLSDLIRRPYDLYRAGVLDEYVMGLMNQVAQAMDDSITQEVTNHLFKKVGARFGMDLVSFNMQRGREFGLPGYMEFRKFCGLSGANSFQDLFGSMPNETVRKYESIFEHPIDVDLWSGGVSERPLPGSMLGPTFACIIATQFSYSRRGDRFWFELPNQPSSFTPEQLTEVRKARLARVICDNTDIIDTVQLYPMVLPDHELNPRVPCRSGIIPSMDFTKWAEPAPFQGAAKQFMTDIHIPPKSELSCEEDVVSTNNSSEINTDAIQGDALNNTLVTAEANKNNPVVKEILTVTINVSTNKNTGNLDSNSNQDIVTANCTESANLDTKIKNNDKVIKYVYNKPDKKDTMQKKTGHSKNSLKRRKRSVSKQTSYEDLKPHGSKRAPLIVDYETSHKPSNLDLPQLHSTSNNLKNSNLRFSQKPSHTEIELPTHQQTIVNVIKNSDLADFNIETLHEKENYPIKNNVNLNSEIIDTGKTKQSNLNSDENNKGDRQTLRDSEESAERREYNESRESDNGKGSDERKDYSSNDKQSNRGLLSNTENTSYRVNNDKKINEFNVHADNKRPIKINYNNGPKPYSESEESNEKITYPSNSNRQEHFESNEKDNFKQDKKIYFDESEENYEPKEKIFSFHNDPSYKKTTERSELVESKERAERIESNESNSKSKETDDTDSSEANKYSEAENNSEESTEKYIHHNEPNRKDYLQLKKKKFNNEKPYDLRYNTESSNESKENNDSNKNDKNKTTLSKIQEVDLGDFSYEKIEVNDKGQVVPVRDRFEENLPIASKSENVNNESNEKLTSFKEDSINHSGTDSNEDKGLIRINDEEVKPVIEINGDNNSDEFIGNEPENSSLKIKDESLEEFLNIKDLHKKYQKDKLKVKVTEGKEDIKQQVERIPLNYEHDKSNDQDENRQPLTTGKDLNLKTQVEVSEGTIEIIPTDSPKYDENLNFKFDDVTVSLPEIKLPEDILAYAYEEPHYQKQKKQEDKEQQSDSKFYDYGSLNSDENDKKRTPHDDTDTNHNVDDYDKYYGNYKEIDNYRKKNGDDGEEDEEEEEHADLYEKFVRERFGKRGTFEQRSGKLQNSRPVADPHLYERVQNVLKKTHDIEKQAQKSGDPNAGYMWTLEYGQTL